MKKIRIRSLDTLEKEIYRLRLEAKNMEETLDKNLDHFQENYRSMTMNSFFHKKKQEDEKQENGFFNSFFKNENFKAAINNITDHIADRAAEGIENLINRIFQKKKHNDHH